MPARNMLVIAVDGLRASALGAYGNTAFSTPALDEFAAESRLCDWCFVESVELGAVYRSLWHGDQPLAKSLADCGYETTLVTDGPQVAVLEAAANFDVCVQVPAAEPERAYDISQTALARVFAATCEQIESLHTKPRFVWLHARGMYGPWDAPLDLQEPLLAREVGDPPPADILEPPDLVLDEVSDPDAAFRWSCAYAAQVMALDACIEGVCQTIEHTAPGKWLIVLCGVRGFSLGEHGYVGGVDGRLYAEQLHVPLVWRLPDASDRLSRLNHLRSLADMPPALVAAAQGEFLLPSQEHVIARGSGGVQSIRTAEWSLRNEPNVEVDQFGNESRCELFVRPDVRWEANDVAALCPDVVAELLARLGGHSPQ